jgi:hypothetical protein
LKVNILGTIYTVKEDKKLMSSSTDGVCMVYDKMILHRPVEGMLNSGDTIGAKVDRCMEVIRHEIVYAFFEEAGLADYCSDARLVDWIAKQFPKMMKAMRSAGGLYGRG